MYNTVSIHFLLAAETDVQSEDEELQNQIVLVSFAIAHAWTVKHFILDRFDCKLVKFGILSESVLQFEYCKNRGKCINRCKVKFLTTLKEMYIYIKIGRNI